MANTIQVKRGANASLPTLSSGEFGFSTDTHQVYIGDGAANHELIKRPDLELLNDITDYVDSPTIITGGEITEGTNAGTFKVAALTALLRTTDSNTGRLKYVTKTVEDNIAITAADTLYYIVLNYNAGSPTISLIDTLQAFNNEIPLGSVMKDASNNVHYISGCYRLQDGVAKLHYRAFELYGLYLTEGNTIAYSGTNNFTLTAGVVYEGINRLTQIAYDSAVTTFIPVYQDGAGGWTEAAGTNTIDFGHYDDGDGTLGLVGMNKYGCHWVFRHVDNDAVVYVVYGRGSYSLAEAEVTDVPTTPEHLTNFGCLIGRIVAPQVGGSFASIQMVTDVVFTGQSVATHNDLGGLNAGDYRHLTAAEKTKFDTLEAASDAVYDSSWNGITNIAPSKNAVYDEMETKADKGVNADITSTTALTQITRATGGAFDVAIGGAAGDDFTIATNKLVVEGDTGNVGVNKAAPDTPMHIVGQVTLEDEYGKTGTIEHQSWNVGSGLISVVASGTNNEIFRVGDGYNIIFQVGFTGYPSKFRDSLELGGNLTAAGIVEVITTHNVAESVAASTMYGNVHKITGAYVETLPAAVIGMSALFRASTAAVFSVKAGASDHFEMFDGTILDAADKQTSSGSKNEFIQIYCETANTWITIGQNGAFVDGGA